MSLMIKICGLTTPESVAAAVGAGADAIGFVFHAASPRNIEPRLAEELAAGLPVGVLRVAVTLHPEQSLVDEVLARFLPDVWQGDAADLHSIVLPSSVGRWPVVRSGEGDLDPLPPRLLFEGGKSGKGERADWKQATALARRTELILGGGLDPGNVAAAIAVVRPFGVDVSSGVEQRPGVKDAGLVRQFIEAARAAERGSADE